MNLEGTELVNGYKFDEARYKNSRESRDIESNERELERLNVKLKRRLEEDSVKAKGVEPEAFSVRRAGSCSIEELRKKIEILEIVIEKLKAESKEAMV